jgi:hypothetical protein
VPTPNLTGQWLTLEHDLKWHENLPESKSPEPSLGKGSVISIEVPKHGGAVAITERARTVINGADVYTRLISQLQQLGLKKENESIAAEIEINATSISGVDWGARSSGASTNNPVDLFNTIRSTFSTKSQPVDGFTSKWLGYAELFNNDFVKGTNEPLRNVGQGGFQTAEFPLLAGITYYADDSISSAVHGWAFSRQAIKIFRGPSRAYTVTDPDTETEKYVTKTHMLPKTVDPSLIYRVTGISA